MIYQHHCSSSVQIKAAPGVVFEFLDDPHRLSSHMGKSTWMMAGSKMEIKLDDKKGRGVGAEIILEGRMMGLPLFVREFVTESMSPIKKVWETRGPQNMIVIDQYQMGFELSSSGGSSSLRIFIDYALPQSGVSRMIGNLFGRMYAKWCIERMAKDAANHFKIKGL